MLDHHFSALHEGNGYSGGVLPLGPEYTLNDDHELSLAGAAHGPQGIPSAPQYSAYSPPSAGPASTLVGSSKGLEINLIWDSSVRTSANWQAEEAAVISAAQIFAGAFANHAVINIAVGYGEVNGARLGSNALGESESNGYLVNYATAVSALGSADAGLISSGAMSSGALSALQNLHGESFFLTSGEAKALGLVNATSGNVDGYIGLNNSALMFFPGSGGAIRSTQYDAVGVAAHEISEVLGRMGMEGQTLGGHANVYTALDIFRYSAPHTPDTTPTAGYFSTNNGVTNQELFNNPGNGGDAADWASASFNTTNAFDAFDNPGVMTNVTGTDLLAVASLGYQFAAGYNLTTVPA
jgi:hypothetical protein